MIELAVKTLDGKNRSFCVPDDITVKEFKEKIANSIDITADTQRLIYQGRVLQDEKKLSDYDVNGKTIHVVQRPPPSQRGPSTSASSSAETPPRTTGMSRDGNTFVLGSFTLPVDPSNVQNDGSSVDVHIHLGQVVPPQPQSESQLRIDQARRMIQAAQRTLERLENPPAGSEEDGGSRGSSPMQTVPETPPTSSTASASASASASSSTPPSGNTGGQNSSSTSRNSSRPHSPAQHPAPSALGDLLTEAVTLNQRLQPHLEAYQRLMADDPTFDDEDATRSAQRTFNLVSEALHYVSHAYHSISDLMIDMHRAPPRRLRAPPSLSMPHHMPMQAQVNVQTSGPNGAPWHPTANPAASAPTSSTATPTSTSTASTTSTANASAQTSMPAGPTRVTTTPLPGGGTANVTSSNPYVFMELGPHALTINSISAHVVSTEDGGTPPTPASAPTFTTSATNTQPSPRPSAPTPPGAPPRPQGPPHAIHMQIPMMPGGMGPGGFGPPGGGIVPPEVMQNILQMVTQQAFPRPPGPQPAGARPSATSSASATSSSSTSTTSSTTTPGSTSNPAPGTTPGAAPGAGPRPQRAPGTGSPPGGIRVDGMPPHAAFVIPGMMPGMGPGPLPVDPHLPCDSHHFMTERAQLQANNQNVGGEGTLGGMMANLVSSLMGQHNPHTHPPGHPHHPRPQRTRPTQTPGSTPATSQSGPRPSVPPFNPFTNLFGAAGLRPSGPAPATSTPGGPTGLMPAPAPGTTVTTTEPPFFSALRQFLQEGQITRPAGEPANQATTPANQPSQPSPPSQPTPATPAPSQGEGEFTDEVFAQLVRGISNYVAQAALGRPTDTIANFLTSLGQNYNIAPSEGLLMDVFNVVAHSLTFTDIMAVFYGQPTPLQSLQGPLHDMVRDRVLQGASPTDENIEEAVERLMTDITPEIEQACENAQGRDDIDFRATLMEFSRHHLRVAIRFIMQSSSSDDQFGQHLYTLCQRVVHEFIVLGVHCLQGREQALQRLIEQQMRHISRGVNPAIQQWMVSIPVREMTRMLDEVNIPLSDLEPYIRHTGPVESSPVPSEGSFMSAESTEFCDPMTEDVALAANGQQAEQEAMDIDSPSGSVTVGDSTPEAVSAASVLEAQKKLPPPPTADPQDEVNVVIGSETWHREVPQEWVPVIARDVRRQSREGPQPPFSDAYLHGMPAKRRKIGEKKSEQELTNLNNIVPETLRRAVAAAGAESLTSLDDITEEASASLPLHNAFEQQVCESVRERISKDPDFSAEKFPNANKFFKKGK